ncbi:hypothetical protein BG011_000929 [Mortierella polycephala]|uniref:Chromate transporter n=1 Tax=Mortierella polycephala TaxID=41804 RepID=A0A9P6Q657_9FUNG|nr:hypothetical protein BG011_000929 [Mortierella polycephala]
MSNPYNLPSFKERLKETFYTYFKLGYTTFGGPAAHIAILYDEIVVKRKWVGDDQFTELFAICQALPGPASTELAYSLSLVRSGFICAIVAFLLWSMPGAIVMTVAGVLIGNLEDGIPLWATRLEQGLASAAIGLVALAAYRMSTSLATDKLTRILALVAGGASALYTAPWLLPVLMIAGGIISYVFDAFLTPAYLSWSEKRKRRQKTNTSEENDLEQGSVANEAGISQDLNDAQNTESNEDKASSIHSSIRNRGKVESDSPEDLATSKASETASLKEKARRTNDSGLEDTMTKMNTF